MTDLTAYTGKSAPISSDAAARQLDFRLDPWIAASVLQKAIRRGETKLAVAAAHAYARTRGKGIWRRLLVIAFEDVSIGAPEVIVEAADLCGRARASKERKLDTERLELLVRQLGDAAKDRAPDHLLTTVSFSPRLERARRIAEERSASDHIALLMDASMPIVERALAANLALGLGGDGRMRARDLAAEALFRVYRDLGVPTDLVAATRAAADLTGELITMMTPLLWLEAEKTVDRLAVAQFVPESPIINGVPACALDKHTAAGKAAIRRFAQENGPVREALAPTVRADQAAAVAYMAVFHTEGSAINSRRLWSGAIELERLGVEADMFNVGAHPETAAAVLAAVRDSLNHLHAIRAELFKRPILRTRTLSHINQE